MKLSLFYLEYISIIIIVSLVKLFLKLDWCHRIGWLIHLLLLSSGFLKEILLFLVHDNVYLSAFKELQFTLIGQVLDPLLPFISPLRLYIHEIDGLLH